jgi:hypothetical protein
LVRFAIICKDFSMPINCLTEATMPLSEAARRRPVHVSTLWRWVTRGLRGVRLETTMVGGARVTSLSALERFFIATNGTGKNSIPSATDGSSVAQTLDTLGI